MQLHWVTPKLAVSGRVPLSAAHALATQGITDVVNLTIKPDPKWTFRTLNDGSPDDGVPKPPEWFHRAAQFVSQAQGKVLVHCESGVHRGPSMAYYLLRHGGMSAPTARHLILTKVPGSQIRYQADAEAAL